jgi:hypothetical protein
LLFQRNHRLLKSEKVDCFFQASPPYSSPYIGHRQLTLLRPVDRVRPVKKAAAVPKKEAALVT